MDGNGYIQDKCDPPRTVPGVLRERYAKIRARHENMNELLNNFNAIRHIFQHSAYLHGYLSHSVNFLCTIDNFSLVFFIPGSGALGYPSSKIMFVSVLFRFTSRPFIHVLSSSRSIQSISNNSTLWSSPTHLTSPSSSVASFSFVSTSPLKM